MLLDFNKMKEVVVPGMNNGTGMMTVKMCMDTQGKVIFCTMHAGSSSREFYWFAYTRNE